MDDLRGKVAVVTGAAGGLGLALITRFAQAGMSVVAADRDAETLERAVAVAAGAVSEGGQVVGVATDVSDPGSVDALRDQTFERFGTAHLICNNAAVFAFERMTDSIDLERWRRTIDVNLFGVLHGVRAFLPRLLEQDEGHIVNLASRQGLHGSAVLGAYSTSKFGIVGLSETLHEELQELDTHVGVSVVCPGAIAAERLRTETRHADAPALSDEVARSALDTVDAAVIADLVARAVVEGAFYVITHDATYELLDHRTERIFADADRLGVHRPG
jgi:NAD(P)-dependent dehydrogenase (short-subunit alcohol dehydrogenase family)